MTMTDDDLARRQRAHERRMARGPDLALGVLERLVCARSYHPASAPPGEGAAARAADFARSARFRWARATLDPRCAYAATCGIANALATNAGKGTGPGHMKVEVVKIGAGKPTTRTADLVSALAAFAAAIANDDYDGALKVWMQLTPVDAVELGWQLANATAAVMYAKRPTGGGRADPRAN